MEYGGYPGMMPGYPGAPPGFPGAPVPGYAPPPSFYGYTAGAMGYGQPYSPQPGGMSLGMGVLNFGTSTLPLALGGAAAVAGVAGNFLQLGGASRFTRGLGTALNFMDPVSGLFEMGGTTAHWGWTAGRGLAAARGMGTLGSIGMGVGGASLMTAGALAVPAAALYGAYRGADFALSNIYQGGQNMVIGQALANQLGPSVAPGRGTAGQGVAMGNMLRDLSYPLHMETEEIGQIAKEMTSQRLFQTTRDMKEFREKFTQTMKAVKEIALATQSTIEEASKVFGDLRQQGFYQTADIKAQAALTAAREAATGLSYQTLSQVGAAGAQTARSFGLRGRFGSEIMQRSVAGVAMGVRSGALSEEEVMELGGVEAVGMRLAQQQMQFLGTGRGRAIIAALMGQGGAPDPTSLRNFAAGNMTLEDIVSTAAGRGLGTLLQAGRRESKEAMLPYAGMAMVQMAMAQHRQIYGGTAGRDDIIRMMGTMGLGRQESVLMMNQAMNMPEQLRIEAIEQQNVANQAAYRMMDKRQSLEYRRRQQITPYRDYFQGIGADIVGDISGRYARGVEYLSGGRDFRGGDEALFREARQNLDALGSRPGGRSPDPLFGPSANFDLRSDYYLYSRTARDMGMTSSELESGIRRGSIIDMGREALGQRRYARRGDILSAQGARERGLARTDLGAGAFDEVGPGMAQTNFQSRMELAMSDQSTYDKMLAFRKENIPWGGGRLEAGVAKFREAFLGGGGDAFRQARVLEQESDVLFLAKESGIVSRDTTFEEWTRGQAIDRRTGTRITSQDRETLKGEVATQAKRAGGRMAKSMEDIRATSLEARDLAAARQESEVAINRFMDKFGSRGMLGGTSGQARGLGTRLNTDGKARTMFMEFTRALGALDNPDDKLGVETLKRKKQEIIDHFGPDSPEAKEIEAMFSKARENPLVSVNGVTMTWRDAMSKETSTTGNLSKLMQERALKEHLAGQTKPLKSLQEDIRAGKLSASPAMQTRIDEVLSATESGVFSNRLGATERLVGDMLREGKGISQDELDILTRIGIGGGGSRFGQALNAGIAGDSRLFKTLTGQDLSKDELAAFKSGDAAKILEVLKSKGLDVDALAGDTSEETTREASAKEYVDANTRFVQVVDAFVGKMGKAGLLDGIDGLKVDELLKNPTTGT